MPENYLKLWSLLLALAFCMNIQLSFAKKQKDLKIITEYMPETCTQKADVGDEVHVHYTGRLEIGTVFDTSQGGERGPLPFILGQGKVIPGWERGIHGMCVGERRLLTIPPHLAYGENGFPPKIPGGATLIFETELVDLRKKGMEFDLVRILRSLAMPVAVILTVVYLYNKYQETTSAKGSKKEVKEEKRSSRRKRR